MSDWINCNLPYWSREGESFAGNGLNEPGTLIETEVGVFLIGHINPNRGVCDDCVEFGNDMIIKRYKVVWSDT